MLLPWFECYWTCLAGNCPRHATSARDVGSAHARAAEARRAAAAAGGPVRTTQVADPATAATSPTLLLLLEQPEALAAAALGYRRRSAPRRPAPGARGSRPAPPHRPPRRSHPRRGVSPLRYIPGDFCRVVALIDFTIWGSTPELLRATCSTNRGETIIAHHVLPTIVILFHFDRAKHRWIACYFDGHCELI